MTFNGAKYTQNMIPLEAFQVQAEQMIINEYQFAQCKRIHIGLKT